jgi:glycosyltransferase involved in cell wall biosynthesis
MKRSLAAKRGRPQALTERDAALDAVLLDRVASPYGYEPSTGRSPTPRVTAVVPTLNEEENLRYVLPVLRRYVDEIIVVDGHSTDDTVSIAQSLCPEVQIVLHETRGKGAALRRGFDAATGDIVVMIDADGSNDPREIPRFVGALLSGADFAKGSRFLLGGGTTDMPLHRRMGNSAFVWLVRLFFRSRYSDLCYGYNAFWRDVINTLSLDGDGFEIETMINVRIARAGFRIVEVPSFEAERIHGASNLQTVRDGWRVLKTILHERIRSPSVTRVERRWATLVDLEAGGHAFERAAVTPDA